MISNLLNHFAASCSSNSFFDFPTWYKYLDGIRTTDPETGVATCAPKISGLGDIWLIAAAVLEILLRIAAIAAVIFVIVGGVQLITSEGNPEKTAHARKTITNALIGLVLAVGATALVSFIAGRF